MYAIYSTKSMDYNIHNTKTPPRWAGFAIQTQ